MEALMKKHAGLIVLVACVLLVTSCASLSQSIPAKDVPLVDAEYTILGETTAVAEGTVLLRFINLTDNKIGTIGASVSSPADILKVLSPEVTVKANAVYKALQQLPEADALLEPKFTVEMTDYYFIQQIKVTVKARGIKYAQGAVKK